MFIPFLNKVKKKFRQTRIELELNIFLFKMQNKVIQRRLRALQYPYLNEFDLNSMVKWFLYLDKQTVTKFVSWLEDTVIRQYEPEDRAFIKSYSDMWESGFRRV